MAFMTAHFMCVCRVWEVTESHRESRSSSGEHSPSNTTLQTLSVAAVTLKVCPKKLYPSVFQNTLHITAVRCLEHANQGMFGTQCVQ